MSRILTCLWFVCLAFIPLLNSRGEGSDGEGMKEDDRSKYLAIVARQPFGRTGAGGATSAIAGGQVQPDSLFRDWRLCFIAASEQGEVTVGIANSKSKTSHYLKVGESVDGIELVSADYRTETAVLKSGGDHQVLHMSELPETSSGAVRSQGIVPQQTSYREGIEQPQPYVRRIRPRERRLPDVRNDGTNDQAVLEKHLQEYQMELIRAKGELGPPLPIQLTKEMDDRLVAEGVLPAVEK